MSNLTRCIDTVDTSLEIIDATISVLGAAYNGDDDDVLSWILIGLSERMISTKEAFKEICAAAKEVDGDE